MRSATRWPPEDFERAADLVELAVPEMRRNRQGATVTELGWLKALPDELVHFRPVLSVDYAYALFGGGELEAVEPRLRDAERWLDTTADMRPESRRGWSSWTKRNFAVCRV